MQKPREKVDQELRNGGVIMKKDRYCFLFQWLNYGVNNNNNNNALF